MGKIPANDGRMGGNAFPVSAGRGYHAHDTGMERKY
jgi:hypothetical protein